MTTNDTEVRAVPDLRHELNTLADKMDEGRVAIAVSHRTLRRPPVAAAEGALDAAESVWVLASALLDEVDRLRRGREPGPPVWHETPGNLGRLATFLADHGWGGRSIARAMGDPDEYEDEWSLCAAIAEHERVNSEHDCRPMGTGHWYCDPAEGECDWLYEGVPL